MSEKYYIDNIKEILSNNYIPKKRKLECINNLDNLSNKINNNTQIQIKYEHEYECLKKKNYDNLLIQIIELQNKLSKILSFEITKNILENIKYNEFNIKLLKIINTYNNLVKNKNINFNNQSLILNDKVTLNNQLDISNNSEVISNDSEVISNNSEVILNNSEVILNNQ